MDRTTFLVSKSASNSTFENTCLHCQYTRSYEHSTAHWGPVLIAWVWCIWSTNSQIQRSLCCYSHITSEVYVYNVSYMISEQGWIYPIHFWSLQRILWNKTGPDLYFRLSKSSGSEGISSVQQGAIDRKL